MKARILRFLHFFNKPIFKRIGITFIVFILLFFTFDFISPVDTKIKYSTIVESKEGETMYAFLSEDDKWRLPIAISEISPDLKIAFLAKEDKWFNYHPGVNPLAIIRAIFNNITKGKRTSGASTITMQVARLLKPAQRSYTNKLIEIFRAFQLELHYSQKRNFQNVFEFGALWR